MEAAKNAISELLETCQQRKLNKPIFRDNVVLGVGFQVTAELEIAADLSLSGSGTGSTKQQAKMYAAEDLLRQWREQPGGLETPTKNSEIIHTNMEAFVDAFLAPDPPKVPPERVPEPVQANSPAGPAGAAGASPAVTPVPRVMSPAPPVPTVGAAPPAAPRPLGAGRVDDLLGPTGAAMAQLSLSDRMASPSSPSVPAGTPPSVSSSSTPATPVAPSAATPVAPSAATPVAPWASRVLFSPAPSPTGRLEFEMAPDDAEPLEPAQARTPAPTIASTPSAAPAIVSSPSPTPVGRAPAPTIASSPSPAPAIVSTPSPAATFVSSPLPSPGVNYKGQLLEFFAKQGPQPPPKFEKLQRGPSHIPEFQFTVTLPSGQAFVSSWLPKAKDAEQDACCKALLSLQPPVAASPAAAASASPAQSSPAFAASPAQSSPAKGINHKGDLINKCLISRWEAPVFSSKSVGPPHSPVFSATVSVQGTEYASDPKPTKKAAEDEAARRALEGLNAATPPRPVAPPVALPVNKFEADAREPATKKPPLGYQRDMYREAMKDNVVCVLPTGTGKTLVACMVIKRMHELNPGRKILFLTDRLPLVEQQAAVIHHETGLRVVCCSGASSKSLRNSIYAFDVVVAIAAYYQNLLDLSVSFVQDLSLIVVDEAHHSDKKHPFALLLERVFSEIEDPSCRPKILGLTASPAAEDTVFDTVVQLHRLSERVGGRVYRPKKNAELTTLAYAPDLELLYVSASDDENQFTTSIQTALKFQWEVDDDYDAIVDDWDDDADIPELFNQGVTEEERLKQICPVVLRECFDYGFQEAFDLLQKQVRRLNIQKPELRGVISGLYHKLTGIIAHGGQMTSSADKVVDVLCTTPHAEDTRILVFVSTRRGARRLLKYIEDVIGNGRLKGIRPDIILGHGSGQDGMSHWQQKEVVKKFRTGDVNLLVATSVVEEGFDVQSCNLVIRMDLPDTVVAMIQSRGRARARDSRFMCVVREHTKEHRRMLERKEKNMERAIDFLQDGIDFPVEEPKNKDPVSTICEQIAKFFPSAANVLAWPPQQRGPSHCPTFDVRLCINGVHVASGQGLSVQAAKKQAALQAINRHAVLRLCLRKNI
eukprot:TRINITY_DN11118_c0_g1_i1.p1 TRINITY_DN11118_c0_g1~~TRINITY_DN11118_c0_g1_i1.p1  ORF type:complete len:1106 (+),score=173.27 TRINITY_DN11118_c0_g1_i1:74-3391(+)